jgi:hypothetical protein
MTGRKFHSLGKADDELLANGGEEDLTLFNAAMTAASMNCFSNAGD